jgi:basic membrane protein A
MPRLSHRAGSRLARLPLLLLIAACASAWSGLHRPQRAVAGTGPIRAAFLYLGSIDTDTWSYAHEQGRLAVASTLGIDTAPVPGVTADNTEQVLQRELDQGYNVIFATSFDFADGVLTVAPNYPGAIFEQATGVMTAANVSTYDGRIYQGWYLAGMAAGAMTNANMIGYVAPLGIPEVIRDLDAFTLGARSVNPNAEVYPNWIGTFYDQQKERNAAEQLITMGADVIARESDSTQPEQAAAEHGVWAIAYNALPPSDNLPNILTAPIWHWDVFYARQLSLLAAGVWNNQPVWWGIPQGLVDIAPVNRAVPADARAMIILQEDAIRTGALDVFAGPLRDNTGQMRVAAGGTLSDAQLLSLNWLVDGVVGAIPQ